MVHTGVCTGCQHCLLEVDPNVVIKKLFTLALAAAAAAAAD